MADIDGDLQRLSTKLARFKPGKPLERFITHIRFPRFKNLRSGARINFDFPVTAFVGSNGCGKTSVLHALAGAPERRSTSDYWFSTSVDPIESRNDDPQRYVYGHYLLDSKWMPQGGVVETRKAMVKKENDPEYWEPTKVTLGDSMAPMPEVDADVNFGGPKERVRSLDRWSAVKRNVLYLNFRGELGAFDQFFWFGQLRRKATHSKQDELRKQSVYLRRAIESGKASLVLYRKERVFKNIVVSKEDLAQASEILGKTYDKVQLVEHDLYGGQRGFSALFSLPGYDYSEAFAGSGEIAVLNMVARVREQPKHTLILLDEPEVSLHPGAQKRLLLFLMEECSRKHHQVVFTTHSPHLVEGLPPNAIKVFTADAFGQFDVVNETHPYAAFNRLGATPPNRIKVLVEDPLAKHVVDLALSRIGDDERATFLVDFLPGGASTYLTHRIPTLMQGHSNTWLLLDGDQRRGESKPSSNLADDDLEKALEAVTGLPTKSIILGADGGDDPRAGQKQTALLRMYLEWFHEHVRFLPRSCPEEIVLRVLAPGDSPSNSKQAKNLLRRHLEELGLTPTSTESDAMAQVLFAKEVKGRVNEDLDEIVRLLREMLASAGGP